MQECNHRLHLDDCSPDLRPDSDPNNTSQPTTTARDSPSSTTPRGHPTTSPPPDEASPMQTPEDKEQGYMKITQITYKNETRGSLPPLLPQTKGRIKKPCNEEDRPPSTSGNESTTSSIDDQRWQQIFKQDQEYSQQLERNLEH